MRIQHNIAALNSYRNLGTNNSGVAKNLEKLSSGYRINRAGDDAAGLAISEKMRSQITGLNTATKNANDGISLVQTAEGALTEVHSMLNRMVEIATQSANGVYEDGVDRAALQDEMDALTDEVDRISQGTNFNKRNLLDGSFSGGYTITYKNDPSGDGGAINLIFNYSEKYNGKELTFDFTEDATIGEESVTFDDNGKIIIDLNEDSGYSAEEISNLIKKSLSNEVSMAAVTTDKEAFKNIVTNMSIKGEVTVTNDTGDDNDAFVKDGVTKSDGKSMHLQIGDTNQEFNKLNVAIREMSSDTLGLKVIDVKTEDSAGEAVDVINRAINLVSTQRGQLGAIQNRLEHTINNLSVNAENMTAAESRIRDVDMADEMMKYTKNNILVQASQAMLAQANQVPQGVLQLLQ